MLCSLVCTHLLPKDLLLIFLSLILISPQVCDICWKCLTSSLIVGKFDSFKSFLLLCIQQSLAIIEVAHIQIFGITNVHDRWYK